MNENIELLIDKLIVSLQAESSKLQNISWFLRGKGNDKAAAKLEEYSQIFLRSSEKLAISADQTAKKINPGLSVISFLSANPSSFDEISSLFKKDLEHMNSLINEIHGRCTSSSCSKVNYQLNQYQNFMRKAEKSLKAMTAEGELSEENETTSHPGRYPYAQNGLENVHRLGQFPYAVASR